jgi:hypothetical protein
MATIIMFWDRKNSSGDPIAGIEISNGPAIEIPANACGFRLGLPNHNWHGAWFFAQHGLQGTVFTSGGITYSSAFAGVPSPDAITAKGPVHGCDTGTYEFQTPLGKFGITGDQPVVAGAGSFVADFTDEEDIAWLDFAGKAIEKKKDVGAAQKPLTLPKEFFEEPPEVKGCFRDFKKQLQCPEGFLDDKAAMVTDANFLAFGAGMTPPDDALFVASTTGTIPQVKTIVAPVGPVNNVPAGTKLEVTCPAELVLIATFHKDHTFDPATVQYRFRFAHGPVSTVFSTLVDKDGANVVFHSVPIPLPPPIGQTPAGGGVKSGAGDFVGFQKPEEPIVPGRPPIVPKDPKFAIEPLPANEHKSSVRVEVVNAFEGVISSNWAPYHVVCLDLETLKRGSQGATVRALQTRLNRWLQEQQMTALKVDGIFGPLTEKAVRAFQQARGLVIDGIVGPKTWEQLLSL